MAWTFDELGNIHDGNGNVIKFSEIARVVGTTVVDIQGNPLPISVTDAQSLGGIPVEEMAKVTDIPNNVESVNTVVGGDFPRTHTNKDLVRTQVIYEPKKTIQTLPLIGPELLANTTLNDTGNIVTRGEVSLSATAGTLTVTHLADSGWAGGSIAFTITETGLYAFRVSGDGVRPSLRIYNSAGVTIQTVPVVGEKFLCVTLSSVESYEFVLGTTDAVVNDVTTFTGISFKKVDVPNIVNGDYYGEVFNSSVETFVKTDIPTGNMYGPNFSFSNTPNNNLRLLRDDWTLLQYISSVPNLYGYNSEALVNSDGVRIGRFNNTTDADAFTTVGSTTVNSLDGALNISGGAISERIEVFIDLETVPGTTYRVGAWLSTKFGRWNFQFDDKVVQTTPTASTAVNLDRDAEFEAGFTATNTTTRISIWTIREDLEDTLSLSVMYVQAFDNSVWKVITPMTPMTETPTFSYANTHVSLTHMFRPDASSAYSVEFDSVISSQLQRITIRPDHYYRWSNILNTDNEGVRFGRSTTIINASGSPVILTQQSYDKMRMVRLPDNNLAIICSCTATNQSMVHVKDLNLSGELSFPHGIEGVPVMSISNPLGYAWSETYDTTIDPNDMYYTIHNASEQLSVNYVVNSVDKAIPYDMVPVVGEHNAHCKVRGVISNNVYIYRFIGKSAYHFGGVVNYTIGSKKHLGFAPMDLKIKSWDKPGKWVQISNAAGTNTQITPTGNSSAISVTRGVVLTDVGYNINVDNDLLNTPIGDEYFVESFATNMDGNKLYLDRSTRDTSIMMRGTGLVVTTTTLGITGLDTTAETLNEGDLPGVNPLNLK